MPSFAHPLWLLPALPLFYLLYRLQLASFAEATPAGCRFWLFHRSFVVLLLVFALAGFEWKTSVRRKQVIFLLDVSGSISPEQHEQAISGMNAAMKSLHAPDQSGIVTFASTAAVERFPSNPRPAERVESRLDGSATNFEEAASLADALFSDTYQKNLVVISDGKETTGRGKERFEGLRRK
ncbi:MAG TPA: vWA domain-containing protein, partial [Acidobacteriota bacterium]|nr:vWA domain-containing protein [Acidobacteriota bacterium]